MPPRRRPAAPCPDLATAPSLCIGAPITIADPTHKTTNTRTGANEQTDGQTDTPRQSHACAAAAAADGNGKALGTTMRSGDSCSPPPRPCF